MGKSGEIKKILVPTDFSAVAYNAIQYAASLAAILQAEILLFHTYSLPILSMDTPQSVVSGEIDIIEKVAEERLNIIIDKIHEIDEKVSCHFLYRLGAPVDEILKIIDIEKIDLTVMGTSGGGVIKQVTAGSNTAQIVGDAPCPILAIPENAVYAVIRKMAFATDFLDDDFQAINQLAVLANFFGAEIIIAHVSTRDRKKDKDLLDWFKELTYEKTIYSNISFQLLEHEDIQEGINVFMLDNEIDLLAMSTKKRNFLNKLLHPSQAKKMVYLTKKPLMVFQAEG